MARDLSVQAGVDNSDPANYPNGVILNNATVVGEEIQGDAVQFWMKVLRLANITPNTLPDNETNGFQLLTALEKVIHPDIVPLTVPETDILAFANFEAVTSIDFGSLTKNGNNTTIEGKFTIVESTSATTGTIEFNTNIAGGNIGQRVTAFLDDVEIIGKVSNLIPLRITLTGFSIGAGNAEIEIFGTLIGS